MLWEHAGGFFKMPAAEGEGRESRTDFPEKLIFCSGREIPPPPPNNFPRIGMKESQKFSCPDFSHL